MKSADGLIIVVECGEGERRGERERGREGFLSFFPVPHRHTHTHTHSLTCPPSGRNPLWVRKMILDSS